MNSRIVLPVLAVVLVALAVWSWRSDEPGPGKVIRYRGEKIRLSKKYASFEQYKDDPNNISPAENERVRKLVTEAPLARTYPSREAVGRAVFEIVFPGYGLISFGARPQADGSTLTAFGVEIPRSGKVRYLVFQGRGGQFRLVDDFVESGGLGIRQVREQAGALVYSTADGAMVASRRPLD